MTDNFIAFFYRERLLVAVVSMLIVAGGILALRRLNVDAFPDVTPVQVEIDTEAEGLAPEEIERQITFPIENEMNGISGVTRVDQNRSLASRSSWFISATTRHLLRARAGLSASG
jgi:cobalt-zinc-cadmium resistance protein CzcA